MSEPGLEHLFRLSVVVTAAHDLGTTPHGAQRFAAIGGGRFEGARLRGEVIPGGADWIHVRPDGIRQIDVRVLLLTDDGAVILMRYEGYRLAESTSSQASLAHEYRLAALFECADARYAWMNGVVAVGFGTRHPPDGPVHEIYALR